MATLNTKINAKNQIKDATLDLGRLETNFLKSNNWDINEGSAVRATITGIPDPVQNLDVVNKHYVDQAVIQNGAIGNPEDGTYTDGLFNDFAPTTLVGTAVDRFNEVLKSLAPSPAPALTTLASVTGSVSGKLSSDTSHPIPNFTNHSTLTINSAYSVSGDSRGIISGTTALTGTVASNVAPNYTNSRPYPNYAFGDADHGSLHLELNGTIIQTVDLTTFTSGNSLNAQGSGFNLSASTSVKFDNGNALDLFKYRTGALTIAAASMVLGFNTVKVKHEFAPGIFRTTNIINWIVDNDNTATAFSNESMHDLIATGSKFLSGVHYHTGGTALYDVVIDNAYKYTYNASATAISFVGSGCSIPSQAIPNATSYTDSIVLSNKPVTITSTRLLNGQISCAVTVPRTLLITRSSNGGTIPGILLDNIANDSTNVLETFNSEDYRMHSGLALTNVAYGSGGITASDYDWDSSQHLLTGNTNHNTGLLVCGGELTYPKSTTYTGNVVNGDFSAITNAYAGNPNYSIATGDRTFIRYFYDSAARSNFRLNITAISSTFVSAATALSANNLHLEVLAPNTTVNSTGTVVWKDAVISHSGNDTDIGCYASTFGNVQPTNWGLTLGTKNTSTSGKVIAVRITASAAWTGRISDITLTWL